MLVWLLHNGDRAFGAGNAWGLLGGGRTVYIQLLDQVRGRGRGLLKA